jgi:hypothetical protein
MKKHIWIAALVLLFIAAIYAFSKQEVVAGGGCIIIAAGVNYAALKK